MNHYTDDEYIQKSSVRWLVTGLVLIQLAFVAMGFYLVTHQARDYTREQTNLVIRKTINDQIKNDAVQQYQNNFTTCGLRAIINPQLKALRQAKERAEVASQDKTVPLTQRQRSMDTVKTTAAQIKSTQRILDVFGTIPPGYDCSTLPKDPPEGPSTQQK